MTEQEKYYTPSYDEFHWGFEYEHYEDFDVPGKEKEWHKCTWGKNGFDQENIDYVSERTIEHETIRVKCLDKEDIEGLGWKYKATSEGDYDYFWSSDNLHSIIRNPNTYRSIITIRDKKRNEYYTAFVGAIKNKSELSRIMKMIQIK